MEIHISLNHNEVVSIIHDYIASLTKVPVKREKVSVIAHDSRIDVIFHDIVDAEVGLVEDLDDLTMEEYVERRRQNGAAWAIRNPPPVEEPHPDEFE